MIFCYHGYYVIMEKYDTEILFQILILSIHIKQTQIPIESPRL